MSTSRMSCAIDWFMRLSRPTTAMALSDATETRLQDLLARRLEEAAPSQPDRGLPSTTRQAVGASLIDVGAGAEPASSKTHLPAKNSGACSENSGGVRRAGSRAESGPGRGSPDPTIEPTVSRS